MADTLLFVISFVMVAETPKFFRANFKIFSAGTWVYKSPFTNGEIFKAIHLTELAYPIVIA